MKKTKLFAALLLMAVCAGCGTEKEQATMVTVDIATEHSEKEVVLQDFMDVEYIPLETSDEFVTQGSVMDIGDKYLLVKNWANDGDIFVYDRKTGKGIRKINGRDKVPKNITLSTELFWTKAVMKCLSTALQRKKSMCMICRETSSVPLSTRKIPNSWMSLIMIKTI